MHMYVCEREREKNRERIGNLPARPIDENRDWIRKPGHWGALTSTQSMPPRISTLYRSLLLSSVSQTSTERVRNWERFCVFVFVKNRRVDVTFGRDALLFLLLLSLQQYLIWSHGILHQYLSGITLISWWYIVMYRINKLHIIFSQLFEFELSNCDQCNIYYWVGVGTKVMHQKMKPCFLPSWIW